MPLLLLLTISVLQLGSVLLIIEFVELANINFDPVTLFYGNLQIVVILWVYQTITKYIKF